MSYEAPGWCRNLIEAGRLEPVHDVEVERAVRRQHRRQDRHEDPAPDDDRARQPGRVAERPAAGRLVIAATRLSRGTACAGAGS